MKIGTCVYMRSIEEIPEKFHVLKKNGFDNCQILSWNPKLWTDENAAKLKTYIQEYEIEITAFWCGWEGPKAWNFYEGQITLGLIPPDYRQIRMKNLCDGADFAHKIGVTDIVTHMGFIPENPYDPNFNAFCVSVRYIAEYLSKNGQYLLFETGQETPVTLLRSFEVIGKDNLGINLDTANLILYGKANPVDALDVFGKYVRNIHAKDGFYPTNGHELGKEVKIGEGKVDFRALLKKLRQLGYDSYLTIEREIKGDKQLEDILDSREYLQTIIDEVYN